MKISRITNYSELKKEKERVKERLELNEVLLKADIESLKSSFSFMGFLRNAGGYIFSNGQGQKQVMNTGFQLGMQTIPFLFRRKRSGSIKNLIIERIILAAAPKLLNIASRVLVSILAKTTPETEVKSSVAEPANDTTPTLKSTVVKTTYPAKK